MSNNRLDKMISQEKKADAMKSYIDLVNDRITDLKNLTKDTLKTVEYKIINYIKDSHPSLEQMKNDMDALLEKVKSGELIQVSLDDYLENKQRVPDDLKEFVNRIDDVINTPGHAEANKKLRKAKVALEDALNPIWPETENILNIQMKFKDYRAALGNAIGEHHIVWDKGLQDGFVSLASERVDQQVNAVYALLDKIKQFDPNDFKNK
jgi:hypothetical protein